MNFLYFFLVLISLFSLTAIHVPFALISGLFFSSLLKHYALLFVFIYSAFLDILCSSVFSLIIFAYIFVMPVVMKVVVIVMID